MCLIPFCLMPWTERALSQPCGLRGKDQNDDYFGQWRNWPSWLGTDPSPVSLEPRIECAAAAPLQPCSAVSNVCFVPTLLFNWSAIALGKIFFKKLLLTVRLQPHISVLKC